MTRINLLLITTFLAALTSQASASPVAVVSQDLVGHCDVLAPLPAISDELGTSASFPLDERISAVFGVGQVDACTSSSNPTVLNVLLDITNQTNISFTDLHYVADVGTGFTNFDGTINNQEAVRLDNVGVNKPLIAEIGGLQPLVFEPGETWRVILDDWTNAVGLNAADLGSIGVPSAIFPDPSSGSIVAIPGIPEPATASLLAILGLCFATRRERVE